MSGSLWVCLLWSVGASDMVSVCGHWLLWALPVALVRCVGIRLMSKVGVATLWVCPLWSMGAFDVVSVWTWVTVGISTPCQVLMAKWCDAFNEQIGCVCCGLWVPLMWSVCGCGCCNPLPVFTGLEGVSEWVCESIERSGRGSCLLWSVGTSHLFVVGT